MTTRNQLIKLIHTGRKHLGMDEESYRGLLLKITGYESCADKRVTEEQLRRVVHRLRDLGFEPSGKPETGPQRALIRQIWLLMARCCIVRDQSQRSLDSYCWRMTQQSLLRCTASQCQSVIEALKQWCKRSMSPEQLARLHDMLSKQGGAL